jgi:hypothetical protein
MPRTRIYPLKQNTIASGVYRRYNSSQNPICDLWFGGGEYSNTTNSISRHLVYFDLTKLINEIQQVNINTALTVSYRLKMTNAVPGDKVLERDKSSAGNKKSVASSYDLVVFSVNKHWDEGRGLNLLKDHYLVKAAETYTFSGYSNWDQATFLEAWDEPGIYTIPSASSVFSFYQHFEKGDEDINVDITPMVNAWLSGALENHGLGIAFRDDYESITSDTRYIASFFTNKTNFSYKPHLEVIYDEQYIMDDRAYVSNNRPSRLYLYAFSGNSFSNYYSASTVDILNSSNSIVYSGLVPQQTQRGVYYVDVFMSGATKGQIYKDIWRGVTFSSGYDVQDITQTFPIKDNYYTGHIPDLNEYSVDICGLNNGATIIDDQLIKVFCDIRVNYSIRKPEKPYLMMYRLIMNNEEEVIPWTRINQSYISGRATNFFEIDTSWLLDNQTYTLQLKVEELGTSRILPNEIAFKVMKKHDGIS